MLNRLADPGLTLSRGRYLARFARSDADLRAAQQLRFQAFFGHLAAAGGAAAGGGDPGAGPEALVVADRDAGLDADAFDDQCLHVLLEDVRTGALAGCFRVLMLPGGAGLPGCYAAQYYDLTRLEAFPGPMIELGRFCLATGRPDPDLLRLAWALLTRLVDEGGVTLLFGCSSFAGTDPAPLGPVFASLRSHHLAPPDRMPGRIAPEVAGFPDGLTPDPSVVARLMPPLLRSYLAMGGWVSDHAVIDRHMNTLHVFTGLEIARVPASRARLLRMVAAG